MAGIAGMAQGNMNTALNGLKRASDLQEQREFTGMQMKQAYRQQQTSAVMSGAATGATTGALIGAKSGSAGGPVGAIVGAVIGAGVGYGASY